MVQIEVQSNHVFFFNHFSKIPNFQFPQFKSDDRFQQCFNDLTELVSSNKFRKKTLWVVGRFMNQSCTNYTDLSSLKILMCVKILLRDQIPHSIVCTDPPSHLTWGNFIFVGLLETKFPIANLIYHQDHTLLPNKINWVAATQPIFCVLYKQKTTEVLRQPRPRSELKHQLARL